MRLELNLDFKTHFRPENFFFGVANAPYLCEGGYNYPDGMKNSYGLLELSGKIEKSGEAIRFWTDYEEQIKLAASLGLNAFRLGIEWSRCQPSLSTEPLDDPPPWDEAAFDHYADIIEMVIDHGMQPIITLHHFTHPLWLGLDIWLEERGPDMLIDAEIRMVDEINSRLMARGGKKMAHFVVYNEANQISMIYHLSSLFGIERTGFDYQLPAYDTMLSRYITAYDRIYDLFDERGWGTPHVGLPTANHCPYEFDKQIEDIARLRTWGVAREDAAGKIAECRSAWRSRIDDLARSQLTDSQHARYLELVEQTPEILPPDQFTKTLDALYSSPRDKKLDYLSVNVYQPFGWVLREPGDNRGTVWDEFAMDGEIYRTFILATNDFNTDLPVYMGENSLANLQPVGGEPKPRPDGWTRERYMKTYLMEMIRCMKEGVPIRGYLYWSLVDDFEWDSGFPPRLGLYNYDYVNHKIRDTDGFGQPSGKIYGHVIAALRSGDKARIRSAFVDEYKQAQA